MKHIVRVLAGLAVMILLLGILIAAYWVVTSESLVADIIKWTLLGATILIGSYGLGVMLVRD